MSGNGSMMPKRMKLIPRQYATETNKKYDVVG
jgi:hypothetical protein